MTTRYVDGTDGDNAYNGLAAVWDGANGPKKTCNGAEDTPVGAGDLIHVRSGTYRETLTGDVSGNAGNPIEYRGDYAGVIWPGGGVVRITGSDNDQTATRANCITATSKNYRTFRGFTFDTVTAISVDIITSTDWTVDQCYFDIQNGDYGVRVSGAGQARCNVSNCYFLAGFTSHSVLYLHSATVDDAAHVVSNCRMMGTRDSAGVYMARVGGITVRNCTIGPCGLGIYLEVALAAGQTSTINNCSISHSLHGIYSIAADDLVENYNNIWGCNTARTNVDVGAQSSAYPPLFDTRWFHELVNGGDMLAPFDLASYSQIVNVAGTSPTATDMRGTGTIGAQREWGALEYDSTLEIEGGAGGGGPSIGGRRVRGIA